MANTSKKNITAEKITRTFKQDPYTLRDGHYVGGDGFVVPQNSKEFFERFPQYVARWVRKRLNSARFADVEDWVGELVLHLQCLPKHSKYRREGKTDVIETFDPSRHHGANEARFRNYINLCLANKFNTLYRQRMRDPVCRGALPLTTGFITADVGAVDDEYCHRHSANLAARARTASTEHDRKVLLSEFIRFVECHYRSLIAVIAAMTEAGGGIAAARFMGVSPDEYRHFRYRLRAMAVKFDGQRPRAQTGEATPRETIANWARTRGGARR
jgi:hypothetical protein